VNCIHKSEKGNEKKRATGATREEEKGEPTHKQEA